MTRLILIITTFLVIISCNHEKKSVFINYNHHDELIVYGVDKLQNSLEQQGIEINDAGGGLEVLVESNSDKVSGEEDYLIETKSDAIKVLASSSKGALHGITDLSNHVKLNGSLDGIKDRKVVAQMPFRAIKFNLPWFSYRKGENLQLHYETCRDTVFWKGFLDMMAENHFNTLTLWNLHPYIFMVKPHNFPEASPFTDEEMQEWKTFWHTLFKMAKIRGIETYIVNWNIFVSEEFSKNYGVANYSTDWGFWGSADTSDIIEKYTREIVTQTINEYPDLTGVGLTLGERMGDMTSEQRKDWINRTIIAGLMNANRKAKLIYRAPLSAGLSSEGSTSVTTEKITREALEQMDVEPPIWVEFKYNWSHGHSSPKLSIVHGGKLTDTYWNPVPDNYKVVWTVRNEDFFVLRWSNPQFVKAFLENNLKPYVGGCIIGSECYIPAKDYITKPEFMYRNYAWERQWLFYKTWGNMLYNASYTKSELGNWVNYRLNTQQGQKFIDAYEAATYTLHAVSSLYQGTWDGALYVEGFSSWRDGGAGKFITVDQLINRAVLDSSYINIRDFVANRQQVDYGFVTPLALADMVEEHSLKALKLYEEILETSPGAEMLIELNDIKTWAYLGQYFADKVRGGVALEEFRLHGDTNKQADAILYLEKALLSWTEVVESIELFNKRIIPYMFNQEFSWANHTPEVERDIAIARSAKFKSQDVE